jgi:hypothetical protein
MVYLLGLAPLSTVAATKQYIETIQIYSKNIKFI